MSGAESVPVWVLWTVGAMMVCGLATFLLAYRTPPAVAGSFGLLSFMVGAFVLLAVWIPRAQGAWTVIPFLATFGLFKLLSYFERKG